MTQVKRRKEIDPTLPETARLLDIMAQLRDPRNGCPWDVEQDFKTIVPYTIEEAYEVAEAIALEDWDMLKAELGDLLFQVVFYTQMAEERGWFTFEDVAKIQSEKMVDRHPHVFGNATIKTADAQTVNWEKLKKEERKAKSQEGLLDDVPHAFPALLRASKLQKRAATVGFDWPDVIPVFNKLQEEMVELKEAIAAQDEENIHEELGDLLFVCANLARHCNVKPEEALRDANRKFERRFRFIEEALKKEGKSMDDQSLDALDALWQEAKALEEK